MFNLLKGIILKILKSKMDDEIFILLFVNINKVNHL